MIEAKIPKKQFTFDLQGIYVGPRHFLGSEVADYSINGNEFVVLKVDGTKYTFYNSPVEIIEINKVEV